MKKIILVGLSLLVLSGCALWRSKTPYGAAPGSGIAPLPPYSGPKARVAIADFEVKAAKATSEIGSGLRGMLITALTSSNRFSVVERQALSVVMPEQEAVVSATNQQVAGPQREKIKTADLAVTIAVTEFEPEASGGRAGLGGGGGVGSGALGGLLGVSLNKAHMALEIRISDVASSAVIATGRVKGEASDVSGNFAAGIFANGGFTAGLSAYANTPMEKAIRVCLVEAVRYLTQAIPESYYKY